MANSHAAEANTVRERHLRAFVALAEEVAPTLLTDSQREGLDRLDRDAGNLTAALQFAAATDPEAALRLCVALTHWWKLRGRFAAADSGGKRALAAADPAPSPLRARALWGRSYLLTYAGRYEEAITTAEEALATAEQISDASNSARALDVLGTMESMADPIGCRSRQRRACALARAAGDDWCLVDATQVLAFTHLNVDEYDAGEALLDEVLSLIERSGYREFVA